LVASRLAFGKMNGEEQEQQQQKRVAPLSTVSLDSTYDHDDGGRARIEKRPLRRRCSWAPLYLVVGLILVAVGLVLALDRDNNASQDADEGDPWFSTSYAALPREKGLTTPQKKLVAWLKQMQNESALYVDAGSSNMSLTGVVFPRNDSEESLSLPFDAMLAIDSGVAVHSRQYVALANDKGYKWTETQLALGDSIATDGCLSPNSTWQLDELHSVVKTANWTSDDADESEVSVVQDGETYTVWKEEEDDYSSEITTSACWLVEREDNELGLRLCIPSLDEQLLKADFEEIFEAANGCPRLVPQPRMGEDLHVPLPLRKWFASYKGPQ